MAIAFDTTGVGGAGAPASSITYAHTVTGTDPGMVVWSFTGDVNGGTGEVSAVTHNGSGTGWTVTQALNPGGGRKMDMWDKTAVDTGGTPDVVVTYTNSCYNDAISASYTGVDQTDLEDTSNSTTNATTLTLSVTTTADNCWLASGATVFGVGRATASTGTTQRDNQNNLDIGDSNGAKTPAGSHSMVWTGSGTLGGLVIALKPSAAAFIPRIMMS